MKKIVFCAICALAFASCAKHSFYVSPEYNAYTFFQINKSSQTIGDDIPSAEITSMGWPKN